LKKQFDTGCQDLGFSGVISLYEAKNIFLGLGIEYAHIVENRFNERNGRVNSGIHAYFVNEDGNELGYYTPCMDSVMVFEKPRIVGIVQNLHFIE